MLLTFPCAILLQYAFILFVKIIELLKKIAYFTLDWLFLPIN